MRQLITSIEHFDPRVTVGNEPGLKRFFDHIAGERRVDSARDQEVLEGLYRCDRYACSPNEALCFFREGSSPYMKCLLMSGEYWDR